MRPTLEPQQTNPWRAPAPGADRPSEPATPRPNRQWLTVGLAIIAAAAVGIGRNVHGLHAKILVGAAGLALYLTAALLSWWFDRRHYLAQSTTRAPTWRERRSLRE